MISISDTYQLDNLLSDSIKLLKSTALLTESESIASLDINMLLSCQKNEILFDCDYKIGFFENENGDVFYDYKIEARTLNDTFSLKSTVIVNSSEIIQIDIYGRLFNSEDFIMFPDLYNKVKLVTKTYDIFVFTCKKGEIISLVFHPFFPRIEVFFQNQTLSDFFSQYDTQYHLYRTIK